MRSLQLGRDGARLDKIWLEVLTGIDGQGKPCYDAPVLLRGRMAPSEAVAEIFAGTTQARTIRLVATLWLDAKQEPLPKFEDRLTGQDRATGTELKGIVVERVDGKAISGRLDHVRIKIREE